MSSSSSTSTSKKKNKFKEVLEDFDKLKKEEIAQLLSEHGYTGNKSEGLDVLRELVRIHSLRKDVLRKEAKQLNVPDAEKLDREDLIKATATIVRKQIKEAKGTITASQQSSSASSAPKKEISSLKK